MSETFETKLVRAIEPIKQYALAFAIYHCFESGVFQAVEQGKANTLEHLAEYLIVDKVRLSALIGLCEAEDIFSRNGDVYALTTKGREIMQCRGWYEMFVGGYATTFMQLTGSLRNSKSYATRYTARVASGSCAISHYDAIPLVERLVESKELNKPCFLDVGCGVGAYLVELCRKISGATGIGLEPNRGAFKEAKAFVESADMSGSIEMHNVNLDAFLSRRQVSKPDIAIFCFVLHELLEEEGDVAVVTLLHRLIDSYPSMHIAVVEVDYPPGGVDFTGRPLAQSYYNPYFLLHAFTQQSLRSCSYWEALFARAGLQVAAKLSTDTNVDSTGYEIGYLLSGKQ